MPATGPKAFFCKSVRSIGLFRIPVQEVVFLKESQGNFGVFADDSDNQALLKVLLPGGLDHLNNHDRIVVEELGRVSLGIPNPANPCTKVDSRSGRTSFIRRDQRF